jgi:hypothetical protein
MREEYVESAAYHEAGHMVVAALCSFPLRRCGLRIDEKGFGLASYTKPEGPKSPDIIDGIIVAADAGYVAQWEFWRWMNYPAETFPSDGSHADFGEIDELLRERHPSNGMEYRSDRERLRERCEVRVRDNWRVVDALASALWKKDWAPQAPCETKWSHQCCEKSIEGEEVIDLLGELGIVARIDE